MEETGCEREREREKEREKETDGTITKLEEEADGKKGGGWVGADSL